MQVSSVKNAFIYKHAILQTFVETNMLFIAFPDFEFYLLTPYPTVYAKK